MNIMRHVTYHELKPVQDGLERIYPTAADYARSLLILREYFSSTGEKAPGLESAIVPSESGNLELYEIYFSLEYAATLKHVLDKHGNVIRWNLVLSTPDLRRKKKIREDLEKK